MKKLIQLFIIIAVGIIISLFPVPDGLTREAWVFLSIFISVVTGLIVEPYPAAYIGLLGVITACLFKVGPETSSGIITPGAAISWGLSGFSNSTVWLIFVAFMFASGFEKTGLGKRISLFLVNKLGKKTLGLGYAIAFSDLLLAPIMPSNTARSGGTVFPIVKNIPVLFGSTPDNNPRKIGSYITWVAIASTCITSSMFLTALAPNLLAISLVEQAGFNAPLWGEWFFYFLPVGIILILSVPLVTYLIYPPGLKSSADIPEWAGAELKKMGRITPKEITMTLLFVLALLLWVFGQAIQVNATVSALAVLCLMILFNIIGWEDIVSNKAAWNVLMWFGTLVALADGLNNVGLLGWIANYITSTISAFSPSLILILLLLAFFLVHYFFASITAHVTALFTLFLLTGADIPGLNIPLLTYMLLYSIGLMGIITPYGTGPSPIWYGLGYIPSRTYWLLGAVFGFLFFAVLICVGIPWINLWM